MITDDEKHFPLSEIFFLAAFNRESNKEWKSYPLTKKKLFLVKEIDLTTDTQRLFDGLKSGDSKAIQEIYTTIFPKVKYWMLAHGGTEDDAHDVFQETLENILLKIDVVKSSFEGLTMQIAKHKWYDRIRKNKTRKEVRLTEEMRPPSVASIEETFIEEEKAYLRFKLLEESFGQLSELCQQLMAMIKGDKKVEDIVKQLSFSSANTMYRRKAACMERWSAITKQHPDYKTYML